MTSLWLYKRRACCTARYKHGGYNAVIPMEWHTVGSQMLLMQQQAERRRAEAALRGRADRTVADGRSNVLSFADRYERNPLAGRATASPRGGKQPGSGGAAGV